MAPISKINLSLALSRFEEIFKTLSTGEKREVREVKSELWKMWRKSVQPFIKGDKFLFRVMDEFDQIGDTYHQAAVLSGMDPFYLALADDHFGELKDFIFKNLQHPNGNVREAARKTGKWLLISLSARINPLEYSSTRSSRNKEQKQENIIIARKQYFEFLREIKKLAKQNGYYDYVFEDYGYDDYCCSEEVDKMKPCVLKTLILFLYTLKYGYCFDEIK